MKIDKERIAEQFICAKCHNRTCHVDDAAVSTGPLSRVLPVPMGRYLAVSCGLCGYTEFYNLAIHADAEQPAPRAAQAEQGSEGS